MDLYYNKSLALSDDAIVRRIGEFIKNERLNQNMTQQSLAERAGINRVTLSELESGKRCQIITLIQILRMLKRLDVFDSFIMEDKISPLMVAEMQAKYVKRSRASKQKLNPPRKKSDW
jgi:transcriptional regulator with XRE-family HTH domain